jgi:hypothetical protein
MSGRGQIFAGNDDGPAGERHAVRGEDETAAAAPWRLGLGRIASITEK